MSRDLALSGGGGTRDIRMLVACESARLALATQQLRQTKSAPNKSIGGRLIRPTYRRSSDPSLQRDNHKPTHVPTLLTFEMLRRSK